MLQYYKRKWTSAIYYPSLIHMETVQILMSFHLNYVM